MQVHRLVRVVHVTSGLGHGGAESILLDLLKMADSAEIDQFIVSLGSPVFREELRDVDGSRVIYLNLGQTPVNVFSAILKARKVIKRLEPNVVHTWMYHADIVGGIAAKTLRLPVIWSVFTGSVDPRFYSRLTRSVIRGCAWLSRIIPRYIVSCSSKGSEVHKKIGYPDQKLSVIPIGFDTEEYRIDPEGRSRFRNQVELLGDLPVIGMAARFDPQKDFETFFRAIAIAKERIPELIVFLVGGYGTDEDNKALKEMIQIEKLEGTIRALGFISSIKDFYNGIDLFVLSSHGEGFPRVIGEAMASGTPCVASDVGDCREVISNTGFVVSKGSAKELASAITEFFLSEDHDRQDLGFRARQRIVQNYHLGQMISMYVKKYRGCI